jgi:hypothetical protein
MKKITIRVLGWFFVLACIALVSGSCRRQGVKYGGPPANYEKMMADSIAKAEDTLKQQ